MGVGGGVVGGDRVLSSCSGVFGSNQGSLRWQTENEKWRVLVKCVRPATCRDVRESIFLIRG